MFIWRVLRTKVKLTGMVSCINMKSVSGWYQYSQLEIYSNLYSDHTFFIKATRASCSRLQTILFGFIVYLFAYLVDLGDNGVHTDLIYLNTFWSEMLYMMNIIFLVNLHLPLYFSSRSNARAFN